jgi:hypothetical protein
VINRIRTFLADPGAILDAVDNESHSGSGCSQLIDRGRQLAEDLGGSAPDKVKAILMTLLCRVEIRSDRIDITLSRGRLTEHATAGRGSREQSERRGRIPVNEEARVIRNDARTLARKPSSLVRASFS